jgi:TonB family protein
MGIEGEVILLVVVQENGLPAEINIHQSSGFAILDESAILAVKKWQFVFTQYTLFYQNTISNTGTPNTINLFLQ